MSSFNSLELEVLRWGEQRGILQHSNPMAQASKTIEEVGELVTAINNGDKGACKDAYGDILVTMILGADMLGFSLIECLDAAYGEIDRKSTRLNSSH